MSGFGDFRRYITLNFVEATPCIDELSDLQVAQNLKNCYDVLPQQEKTHQQGLQGFVINLCKQDHQIFTDLVSFIIKILNS